MLRPTDLDALFLSGEVLIGADGPALRECLTGRVYPVGQDAAYPELAAAVEAKRPGAGSPLLVSLEARITHPAPGLVPQFPQLSVLRFVNAFPGEACARPEPVATFANTYWRIDSLDGEALPPVDGRRAPHLVFMDAPGPRFRATVGCNQLIGGYGRDGDDLTFLAGASTMMACPPPLDASERALRAVLDATPPAERADAAIRGRRWPTDRGNDRRLPAPTRAGDVGRPVNLAEDHQIALQVFACGMVVHDVRTVVDGPIRREGKAAGRRAWQRLLRRRRSGGERASARTGRRGSRHARRSSRGSG